MANDYGYEKVYSHPLETLIKDWPNGELFVCKKDHAKL
jgi:phosphoheptose isomerase